VSLPEGWMVKSITQGGRDIADVELSLRSREELRDVEIVITDRMTTVTGQLLDAKSQPIHDATVVVFSADSQRWFESSRSVKSARPDQQGHWRVRSLPPGEYLAIALEYIEDTAWNDPDYLESLRQFATKVTLAEGGSETLSLKLATPR